MRGERNGGVLAAGAHVRTVRTCRITAGHVARLVAQIVHDGGWAECGSSARVRRAADPAAPSRTAQDSLPGHGLFGTLALGALSFELVLRGLQRGARLFDRWVSGIDLEQSLGDHGGCNDSGKPFAVSRDHIPGRPLGAGLAQHLRERGLVCVPVSPLSNVRRRELPVLLWLFDAREKTLSLRLLREVQEELDDVDPVGREVPLKVVDLAKAALPDLVVIMTVFSRSTP